MKVFTADGFRGHYPVGTAAVIMAENEEQALLLLNDELKKHDLPVTTMADSGITHRKTNIADVVILCDGNY
jgi:hypothetical protein